jgi:hypothetical protein
LDQVILLREAILTGQTNWTRPAIWPGAEE